MFTNLACAEYSSFLAWHETLHHTAHKSWALVMLLCRCFPEVLSGGSPTPIELLAHPVIVLVLGELRYQEQQEDKLMGTPVPLPHLPGGTGDCRSRVPSATETKFHEK